MNVISEVTKAAVLYVEDQGFLMPIIAKSVLRWRRIGMDVENARENGKRRGFKG